MTSNVELKEIQPDQPVEVAKRLKKKKSPPMPGEPINSETNRILNEKKTPNTSDMEFVWENLVIEPKLIKKGVQKKKILSNVSGSVKSGECLAIIGSSGAGKTTLLNYLSRKTESTTLDITGEVTLNGEKINDEQFNLIASYVMQDDILEAMLTPLEILIFTAKLKLAMSNAEIDNRVKTMINDLNLNRCQHTRIGNGLIRGVSGGERKRTSIAVELISDPKIVFLDEPTTGLDSYNAYEVIDLLNILASRGKIIIFTIHQPSSEIFHLLNKLCILALGKTVYFGPKDNSFTFFEDMKMPVPLNYNPFEHFMEMTNISITNNRNILNEYKTMLPDTSCAVDSQVNYEYLVSHMNQKFYENKEKYGYVEGKTIQGFTKETDKIFNDKRDPTSFLLQYSLICGKNIILTLRDKKILVLKMVQSIFTALLIVAIYSRLSKNYSGIQDRIGLILMFLTTGILNASISTVLVFADENKVFTRERSNKLYSVLAYYTAKVTVNMPIYFVVMCLFGLLVYFATDLNDTYMGIFLLSSYAGASWGYMLGTLAKNPEALLNMNTALSISMLLLSGFFTNATNYAPYLIPFKYISIFKYTFQLFVGNEFEDSPALNCQNLSNFCQPLANQFTFLEPFYISFIGVTSLYVALNILSFIFIYFFSKLKV